MWARMYVMSGFFFFKQKTAYEITYCDWSSDVCSSDLDGGYLLFSDPNANTIYKYAPNGNAEGKLEVFRTPSGYSGADIAEYGQPGSNGLTLDPQGRLTINQHGNHRVVP